MDSPIPAQTFPLPFLTRRKNKANPIMMIMRRLNRTIRIIIIIFSQEFGLGLRLGVFQASRWREVLVSDYFCLVSSWVIFCWVSWKDFDLLSRFCNFVQSYLNFISAYFCFLSYYNTSFVLAQLSFNLVSARVSLFWS